MAPKSTDRYSIITSSSSHPSLGHFFASARKRSRSIAWETAGQMANRSRQRRTPVNRSCQSAACKPRFGSSSTILGKRSARARRVSALATPSRRNCSVGTARQNWIESQIGCRISLVYLPAAKYTLVEGAVVVTEQIPQPRRKSILHGAPGAAQPSGKVEFAYSLGVDGGVTTNVKVLAIYDPVYPKPER